jgi:hypothetical protein
VPSHVFRTAPIKYMHIGRFAAWTPFFSLEVIVLYFIRVLFRVLGGADEGHGNHVMRLTLLQRTTAMILRLQYYLLLSRPLEKQCVQYALYK